MIGIKVKITKYVHGLKQSLSNSKYRVGIRNRAMTITFSQPQFHSSEFLITDTSRLKKQQPFVPSGIVPEKVTSLDLYAWIWYQVASTTRRGRLAWWQALRVQPIRKKQVRSLWKKYQTQKKDRQQGIKKIVDIVTFT